jgi:hypothetical protein
MTTPISSEFVLVLILILILVLVLVNVSVHVHIHSRRSNPYHRSCPFRTAGRAGQALSMDPP